MRTGRAGQHGGVSTEQVAVVAVVAALIAAVWATGVAPRVAGWATYAACALFATSDDCERPEDGGGGVVALDADDGSPPVCQIDSRERHRRTTTDLLFRRNVSGDRFVVTELSDGTMIIIDTEYEGSGIVIGAGGEIPLGQNSKLSLSADLSGVDLEEAGLVYHLTPDAYRAYQDELGRQARDAYIHGTPELQILESMMNAETPEDFLATAQYGDIILRELQQRIESHATHDLYRTRGEVTLNAGGSWKLLSAGLTVGGSGGSTLQVDRTTGASDLTIDLTLESAASLGVGVLGAGASGGSADARGGSITLSYDPDGEITGVSTSITYELKGSGFVGVDLAGVPGAPDGGARGVDWGSGFGWHGSSGSVVELTFDLPIDSEAAQDRVERFLSDPVGVGAEAFSSAVNDGTAMFQAYELAETSSEVGAAIRAIVSLGASTSDSTRQLQLQYAASYDGVNGLMTRGDCVR